MGSCLRARQLPFQNSPNTVTPHHGLDDIADTYLNECIEVEWKTEMLTARL